MYLLAVFTPTNALVPNNDFINLFTLNLKNYLELKVGVDFIIVLRPRFLYESAFV